MKIQTLFLIALFVFIGATVQGQSQNENKPLQISDLIVGYKGRIMEEAFQVKDSSSQIYTFTKLAHKNPFSESGYDIMDKQLELQDKIIDSLITLWIKKHPNAILIPVSSERFRDDKKSPRKRKYIYCWVVSQKDTLNNYLIHNGTMYAVDMERPQKWDELTPKEKAVIAKEDCSVVEYFIDVNKYDNFIQQVKWHEEFARKNKLGIWAYSKTK